MITRGEVVQSYLDMFPQPNYLEIGVQRGITFHSLTAARKVAVDPAFLIEPGHRQAEAEYFEMTSDAYFTSLAQDAKPFDVIYIDGLHTFEQTLRDLINSVDFLRRDGVIIIDDILPNFYYASLPDYEESLAVMKYTGGTVWDWMGDVYKLAYFIQSFFPLFDYATVADNHGQLVMWRGKRANGRFAERQVEDIARLEFRHIVMQREAFNFLPNDEIVRRVRQAIGGGAQSF